ARPSQERPQMAGWPIDGSSHRHARDRVPWAQRCADAQHPPIRAEQPPNRGAIGRPDRNHTLSASVLFFCRLLGFLLLPPALPLALRRLLPSTPGPLPTTSATNAPKKACLAPVPCAQS